MRPRPAMVNGAEEMMMVLFEMKQEKERRRLAVRIDLNCYSVRQSRIGQRMKPEESNQVETVLGYVADAQPLIF